jgi:hypothetical protein
MAKLDRNVAFVPVDRVAFSAAAKKLVRDGLNMMMRHSPEEEWIAVMSLGVDGPWLGFDKLAGLSSLSLENTSDGLLVSMPIRLEESEILEIDCAGTKLYFSNVDISKL